MSRENIARCMQGDALQRRASDVER